MSNFSSDNKGISINNSFVPAFKDKIIEVKEHITQEAMETLNGHNAEVEEYDLNAEQIDIKNPKYNDFLTEFQQRSQKKRDESAFVTL